MNNKNKPISLSKYDKTNNLIKYIEFTNNHNDVKCSYSVNGNVLERTYLQNYKENDVYHIETLNSIIEYSDNIMLFSLSLDGETYLQPILSGQNFTSINPPNIINSVFSTQIKNEDSAFIETFNVKNNLIDDYLNKL